MAEFPWRNLQSCCLFPLLLHRWRDFLAAKRFSLTPAALVGRPGRRQMGLSILGHPGNSWPSLCLLQTVTGHRKPPNFTSWRPGESGLCPIYWGGCGDELHKDKPPFLGPLAGKNAPLKFSVSAKSHNSCHSLEGVRHSYGEFGSGVR